MYNICIFEEFVAELTVLSHMSLSPEDFEP